MATTTASSDSLVPTRRLGVGAAGLGAVALVATVVALAVTGAASATILADPGAATRWGQPVVRTVFDLSASLTVGLLVLAAVAMPTALGARGATRTSTRTGQGALLIGGVTLTAVRTAALTGAVWVGSGAVGIVLTYAKAAGISPASPGFAVQLGQFVTQVELLRALLVGVLLAAVVTTIALLATRASTVGWGALLAVLALLPVALTGHSAGTHGHELAVDSLAFHLVGVSVWVGALGALVLLRGRLGLSTSAIVRRYSTLALWSFVLVGASGVVNAWLRVGGWANLDSAYGALVAVKTVALVLLGLAGAAHRRRTIATLDAGAGARFWRLVVGELVVMAVAIGVAVALAGSEPPVSTETVGSSVLALTGYPMPTAPTATTFLTAWRVDLLWVSVAGVLLGLYLAGAVRLRRRGDRWPVLRTVSWTLGCLAMVYTTSGQPGIYGRVLFSQHMLGHMIMSMVVPSLLVLGAPVTLAVRTLPRRRDGSRGPREWLLEIVHSRLLGLLGRPVVAAVLFTGSLVVFYYSGLFELSLTTHTGHVLMNLHFLLVGYLFASALIGVDPGPTRPAYPMRLVVLFATMAFHAFFSVSLQSASSVLAPTVLTALGRTWGRSPIADQQLGGAVAWAVGEIPTLLLGVGIAVAWVRSDDRESRRGDRQADRDGDAELTAYNTQLAELGRRRQGPA
jgi:cytochrome c oxidase assembly factor CtaG/putative copper export protein